MEQHALNVSRTSDLIEARSRARTMARRAGLGVTDESRFVAAVTELALNALQHAGGVECVLRDLSDTRRVRLEVEMRDHGPDIADVDLATRDGCSISGGLGVGLPGTKRTADVIRRTRGGLSSRGLSAYAEHKSALHGRLHAPGVQTTDAVDREFLRQYRRCFEGYLGAQDPETEEEALFATHELGRKMLAAGCSKDDLLNMHARVQRIAVARFASSSDALQRRIYRRMASGYLRVILHELLVGHDFVERDDEVVRWVMEHLKHQSVLDALDSSVVLLDVKGTITNFNRAWCKVAVDNGNPELRGCGVGDNYLAACGTVPELLESMRRVLTGGESLVARYEGECFDGKRWYVLRASTLPGAEGGRWSCIRT